jgi:hypothetical protein
VVVGGFFGGMVVVVVVVVWRRLFWCKVWDRRESLVCVVVCAD